MVEWSNGRLHHRVRGPDERWSVLIGDRRIARAIRAQVEREGEASFRPRMAFADPGAYGIDEGEIRAILATIPPRPHHRGLQAVAHPRWR